MTIPTPGTVPMQATLSEPVEIYKLDPATEAAADTWPLVVSAYTYEGPEVDPETGRTAIAVRCVVCRQMVGFQAGYGFCLKTLRPRVLEHIIRSHGHPANPTRVDN